MRAEHRSCERLDSIFIPSGSGEPGQHLGGVISAAEKAAVDEVTPQSRRFSAGMERLNAKILSYPGIVQKALWGIKMALFLPAPF
jgi:hypothetical protein